jgi:hypothetical protein
MDATAGVPPESGLGGSASVRTEAMDGIRNGIGLFLDSGDTEGHDAAVSW